MTPVLASLSRVALLLSLVFLPAQHAAAAISAQPPGPGWTPADHSNDFAVFYRDNPQLGAREVYAVAEENGSPASFFTGIGVPGVVPYVRWNFPLKQVGPTEEIDYVRIKAPVVDERESVLHVQKQLGSPGNGGVYRISWHAVPGYLPPEQGVVRMEVNNGSWTFAPLDGGRRTRITYRITANPAGSIPRWLSAPQAVKTVPSLFKSLEKWVASHPPAPGMGGAPVG